MFAVKRSATHSITLIASLTSKLVSGEIGFRCDEERGGK